MQIELDPQGKAMIERVLSDQRNRVNKALFDAFKNGDDVSEIIIKRMGIELTARMIEKETGQNLHIGRSIESLVPSETTRETPHQ